MEKKYYTAERNVQIVIALLKANGIKRVIASPGTTNMTFVGSIQNDPFFEIFSSVDERSAAYLACGMAAETGEPVVLSCTGATASRNYMSGLTEAYYRKLPVLAITSHRGDQQIGHLLDQQIDRRVVLKAGTYGHVGLGVPLDGGEGDVGGAGLGGEVLHLQPDHRRGAAVAGLDQDLGDRRFGRRRGHGHHGEQRQAQA